MHGDTLRADWLLLTLAIDELMHDLHDKPGADLVVLVAELLGCGGRRALPSGDSGSR